MDGMTDNSSKPSDDPMPVEPPRPGPDDCCHSGCVWCVQDMYEDAMDRYRAELAAWKARHPAA
jgi:hypothetical protein